MRFSPIIWTDLSQNSFSLWLLRETFGCLNVPQHKTPGGFVNSKFRNRRHYISLKFKFTLNYNVQLCFWYTSSCILTLQFYVISTQIFESFKIKCLSSYLINSGHLRDWRLNVVKMVGNYYFVICFDRKYNYELFD